jgi:hypothetical protein
MKPIGFLVFISICAAAVYIYFNFFKDSDDDPDDPDDSDDPDNPDDPSCDVSSLNCDPKREVSNIETCSCDCKSNYTNINGNCCGASDLYKTSTGTACCINNVNNMTQCRDSEGSLTGCCTSGQSCVDGQCKATCGDGSSTTCGNKEGWECLIVDISSGKETVEDFWNKMNTDPGTPGQLYVNTDDYKCTCADGGKILDNCISGSNAYLCVIQDNNCQMINDYKDVTGKEYQIDGIFHLPRIADTLKPWGKNNYITIADKGVPLICRTNALGLSDSGNLTCAEDPDNPDASYRFSDVAIKYSSDGRTKTYQSIGDILSETDTDGNLTQTAEYHLNQPRYGCIKEGKEYGWTRLNQRIYRGQSDETYTENTCTASEALKQCYKQTAIVSSNGEHTLSENVEFVEDTENNRFICTAIEYIDDNNLPSSDEKCDDYKPNLGLTLPDNYKINPTTGEISQTLDCGTDCTETVNNGLIWCPSWGTWSDTRTNDDCESDSGVNPNDNTLCVDVGECLTVSGGISKDSSKCALGQMCNYSGGSKFNIVKPYNTGYQCYQGKYDSDNIFFLANMTPLKVQLTLYLTNTGNEKDFHYDISTGSWSWLTMSVNGFVSKGGGKEGATADANFNKSSDKYCKIEFKDDPSDGSEAVFSDYSAANINITSGNGGIGPIYVKGDSNQDLMTVGPFKSAKSNNPVAFIKFDDKQKSEGTDGTTYEVVRFKMNSLDETEYAALITNNGVLQIVEADYAFALTNGNIMCSGSGCSEGCP